MKPVLLIDFGSTNTKVTAVDIESERLLGTAAAYTTVQTDVNDGLEEALSKLREITPHLYIRKIPIFLASNLKYFFLYQPILRRFMQIQRRVLFFKHRFAFSRTNCINQSTILLLC